MKRAESICGQVSQQRVPGMIFPGLDRSHQVSHLPQHFRPLLIVNVALQQLENLEPVLGIHQERRVQNIQSVVKTYELIPVSDATTDRGFEVSESLPREVTRCGRCQDVVACQPRTVERNADAAREDGIDKTCSVPDKDKAIPTDLPHRVAVISFFLERANLFSLAQTLSKIGAGFDASPEKALA